MDGLFLIAAPKKENVPDVAHQERNFVAEKRGFEPRLEQGPTSSFRNCPLRPLGYFSAARGIYHPNEKPSIPYLFHDYLALKIVEACIDFRKSTLKQSDVYV